MLMQAHRRIIVFSRTAINAEEGAVVSGPPFNLGHARLSPLLDNHLVYLGGVDVHERVFGFELHLFQLVLGQSFTRTITLWRLGHCII